MNIYYNIYVTHSLVFVAVPPLQPPRYFVFDVSSLNYKLVLPTLLLYLESNQFIVRKLSTSFSSRGIIFHGEIEKRIRRNAYKNIEILFLNSETIQII